MFVIGTLGNAVTHATQKTPNGHEWGPEEDIKKGYAVAMDVLADEDGALHLFSITPATKELRHSVQMN